jgi:hypothetical protein
MPHTLEYAYALPSPTPASPTPVATPLDPWFLATKAAPALDAVKVEEEEVVTGPGIGYLINPGGTRAARTGVSPYYVMDIAGPSAPPPATAPTPPSTMRAEAAARMKAQALPDPPPAETLLTPTLRRLLGRKTVAVDRRLEPDGSWPPERGGPQYGSQRQRLLLSRRGGVLFELKYDGSGSVVECDGEVFCGGGGFSDGNATGVYPGYRLSPL